MQITPEKMSVIAPVKTKPRRSIQRPGRSETHSVNPAGGRERQVADDDSQEREDHHGWRAVTLRGPVNSAEEKMKIEKLAKTAAGEAKVDNQLEVKAADKK